MAISRTSIARVPGHIKFGSSTYLYPQGPIEINLVTERFPVTVDGIGKIEERPSSRRYEITVTPCGEIEALAALFPYASTIPGASVFTVTDVPLIVYGRDNKTYTFHAAAVTGMALTPRMGGTYLGGLTFTAILKDGAAPGDTGAYYTLDTSLTYPGDSNFSRSAIVTPPLTGVWGASDPWDSFHTREGFDVQFQLDLQPEMVDGLGLVDMKFVDVQVSATCTPVGVTASQLYALADANLGIGSSPTRNDLIVSGTGFYLALKGANAIDPNLGFSSSRPLAGQVQFMTNRAQTTGVSDAVFVLATAAP
jgi:hypothetical protein